MIKRGGKNKTKAAEEAGRGLGECWLNRKCAARCDSPRGECLVDLVVSEAQVAARRVARPGESTAAPARAVGPAARGSPPLHEAACATAATTGAA